MAVGPNGGLRALLQIGHIPKPAENTEMEKRLVPGSSGLQMATWIDQGSLARTEWLVCGSIGIKMDSYTPAGNTKMASKPGNGSIIRRMGLRKSNVRMIREWFKWPARGVVIRRMVNSGNQAITKTIKKREVGTIGTTMGQKALKANMTMKETRLRRRGGIGEKTGLSCLVNIVNHSNNSRTYH